MHRAETSEQRQGMTKQAGKESHHDRDISNDIRQETDACKHDKFLENAKNPSGDLARIQTRINLIKSGSSGDLSKIGEIINGGTCEGQARNGRTPAESALGQLQRQPQIPGGITSGGI